MSLLGQRWYHKLYQAVNQTAQWRTSFQHKRLLTRTLQPFVINDDELTEVSKNQLETYEAIMKRYHELSAQAFAGGGKRGIERHVTKNKKVLVRDRIKMLIDPGTTFLEIGHFAGFQMMYGDIPCGGTVGGIGRVGGIYCMIGGNDATVKGGTYFPVTVTKSARIQDMSEINRLPCIYMPDSGGAYLPLQADIFIPGGRSFYNQAIMSSKGIPQIAIVLGSCTAGGAYNPTMSDEAIIVDAIGKIYLGGPPLVKAATGEIVTEEDLGGAFMHSVVSGCTDYYAKNEEEAFEMCRDVVESLNLKTVVGVNNFNQPLHTISSWNYFAAKNHLSKSDLYTMLAAILDGSQFKEFKAFFGPGLICGIGSIEGSKIGIVANADDILSAEALKATHFLDTCGRRDIPVLFLQNSLPRNSTSISYDQSVLKDRGKLSSMVAALNTPKITLTLTACYEDDFLLMCGQSFKPNFHFMWPSAKVYNIDMTVGEVNYEEDSIDAFACAANVLTDAIILPEDTRNVIGEVLRILHQQKLNPSREHIRPVFRM